MANRYPLIVTNTTAGDTSPFAFKELPAGDDFRLDGTGASTNNPIRAGGTTTELPIIKDANGNTVISLPTPTANANNYFIFTTSNGTGGINVLEAAGTGTDIHLHLKPKGGGSVQIGTSGATGILQSRGSYDLKLQAGSSTTGNITITQGANSDITISPNGNGKVVVTSTGISIPGSTSGNALVVATATAGTPTITLGTVSGTVVTTGDSGSVTSTMIANDTIVNADINSGAAIAYSKLSLSGSIVNGDISSSAAIAGTKISPDFGSQNIVTTGNIELGNASDTTLSRASAGQVNIEGIQILTQTNSVTGITNKTLTNPTLTAGTSSVASMTITNGTVLSTVTANSVEFDGTTLNFTPNTNYGRASVPIAIYTSGTGTSLTQNQETTNTTLFPGTNDTITLPVGTYYVVWNVHVTRGASTTSAQLRVRFGGTATATFSGTAIGSATDTGAANAYRFNATGNGTDMVITPASTTSGGVYVATITGILRVTTSGTIIPGYSLSALLNVAAAALPASNSLMIQSIATSGSAASTGAWA